MIPNQFQSPGDVRLCAYLVEILPRLEMISVSLNDYQGFLLKSPSRLFLRDNE